MTNGRDSVPSELADELEGQEEEVKPDGAEAKSAMGRRKTRKVLTV